MGKTLLDEAYGLVCESLICISAALFNMANSYSL